MHPEAVNFHQKYQAEMREQARLLYAKLDGEAYMRGVNAVRERLDRFVEHLDALVDAVKTDTDLAVRDQIYRTLQMAVSLSSGAQHHFLKQKPHLCDHTFQMVRETDYLFSELKTMLSK